MAIKSKGKRPFIVRMPNEPSPLLKYQEPSVFVYRGDRPTDPNNYSNFRGETIVDYVMHESNGNKNDIGTRSFRSKDTLVNWLLRNGYAARSIPEGIYLRWGYGNEDSRRDIAYRDTKEYIHWKNGDVYAVASVDDPSVTEAIGDTIHLDSPKQLPPGAVLSRDKFGKPRIYYGDDAESYIKRARDNAADKGSRRYRFEGRIEDLTPEQARMLGSMDDDVEIGRRIYVNPYGDHKGPGNVVGDIIRTKNTRPGMESLPAIGQEVYTPRFLHVDIYEVFPTYREMCKAGYTEPTHFDGPFEVQGKVTGQYTMKFAASPKRP